MLQKRSKSKRSKGAFTFPESELASSLIAAKLLDVQQSTNVKAWLVIANQGPYGACGIFSLCMGAYISWCIYIWIDKIDLRPKPWFQYFEGLFVGLLGGTSTVVG